MEVLFKYLSDIRIVIGLAVLVAVLFILLIVSKIRSNKAHKRLEDLEVRYNTIKSVPLSFKLNKAVAISRVEPEAMTKVAQTKDDFDKCEANLHQISKSLADTEDEILAGKIKKANKDLDDLEAAISLGEDQVKNLQRFLDSMLEKESTQRDEVNVLKNRFRDLKEKANANSSKLSGSWSSIESTITATEKMFSAFEEWMYASDFEKANAELANIKASMDKLEGMIASLPELMQEATGILPKMAEVLNHDYAVAKDKGVYLKHIQVEQNLNVIMSGLKSDVEHLKEGNAEGVKEHLADYKTRITQMDAQVKNEVQSYEDLATLSKETTEIYTEVQRISSYVEEQYGSVSRRYGLSDMDERLSKQRDVFTAVSSRMPHVMELYSKNDNPASGNLAMMKELNQDLSGCLSKYKELRAEIDSATNGEGRAKKQLVKLQVIMNQMQVKIRKYKLPNISQQYDADMKRAEEYIDSLNNLMNATPLNVQVLNSTLKEAIDFIYRLYNNVNNVVATVMMVENAVVFGSRYRSTYPDIDSELTRSELCFRNGDYTQALTIAIATIEKIHPGNYENMIKENASA